MRAGRYSIIIGLLVLIATLAMGSHADVHHSPFRVSHAEVSFPNVTLQRTLVSRHNVAVFSQGSSSDQNKHKEKRHGKSLVSQGIVADCPVAILPDFTFCRRHYSQFLPGGCTRQFIGNFSLRGPPVC